LLISNLYFRRSAGLLRAQIYHSETAKALLKMDFSGPMVSAAPKDVGEQ
jgi:hypothetical protein